MKIIELVVKIWELIWRIACIITKIDEMFVELKDFYDWLFYDEPKEPETRNGKRKPKSKRQTN